MSGTPSSLHGGPGFNPESKNPPYGLHAGRELTSTKGYPMKGLSDTDQRLMLSELTVETANAAVATIARHATSRADLLHLLEVVAPSPHTPDPVAPARRAMPLRGVSAR